MNQKALPNTPQKFLDLGGWWQKSMSEDERTGASHKAFSALEHEFVPFTMSVPQGKDINAAYRLWDIARAVLGKDIGHEAQQTGDCVAAGMELVANYRQVTEIALGDPEEYKPVFRPYLYGTGRVYIGGGQYRGSAGSSGTWQAEAVRKYGLLRRDFAGVPGYSGGLCDRWGDSDQEWKKFVDEADNHLIQRAAPVRSLEELATALSNGEPATTASNRGYTMTAGSDGYHRESGSWPHQMHILGIQLGGSKPWVAQGNQWGDVHGVLKDFETGQEWPRGVLRIRPEDMARRIQDGEVYVYSGLNGFEIRDPWGRAFGWS